MFKFQRFFLATVLLMLSFSTFAQEAENDEKEIRLQKLAEQVLADVQNLKLPENRAIVLAQVGSHLWKTDANRATKLFSDAINELIKAQNAETDETDDGTYPNYGLLYGQTPRWNILNSIANRDAELALDLQKKSRPATLAEMVANISNPGSKPNRDISNQHYAVHELNMEKQFMIMAAEQNPERAVEFFRKSLKSGVSYNALNFLNNLYKKSPDEANKLLEEVFETLLSMKLEENSSYNDFSTMLSFLTIFGNKNPTDTESLKISDSLLRDLADKVSNYWLNLKNSSYYNEQAFKVVEKFYPNRLARIRQKQTQQNSHNEEYLRYNELTKNNPTAEELLKEAENFSSYRTSIYSMAASKLAQNGNLYGAIGILNSNLSSQEAKNYIAGLYQNQVSMEISKGNFDRAESIADQMPSKQGKISSMINIAQSIYSKNPEENKNWAASVLGRADSLIALPVENLNDASHKINIANAFAQIDSGRTFQTIESLIPVFNEYSKAQITVSKFRNDRSVKDGEVLIDNVPNMFVTGNLAGAVQQLQMKDFDRTMQLINDFERFETRLYLKLQLLNQMFNLPLGTRFSNVYFSKRGG